MASFKVLNQRELERRDEITSTFMLTVVPFAGDIYPGLEFIAYCTHHPFTVIVRSMERNGALCLLRCETTWPVYERHLDDAVINTAGTNRKERFFYDYENQYDV